MRNRKAAPRHHRRFREFEAMLEKKAKIPACFGSEFSTRAPRQVNETLKAPAAKHYAGQRCALLTTKSRKTCTRATVFNSSG